MIPDKNKAAIGFIFITLLIDVIGVGIIIPVFPKLIAELTHETNSSSARYGGWLFSSYAIMQFLFAPILGGLSDRFGRRPVILCSLFGFGVDYLILSFAPNITWLFIGRILAGITGASFTVASAYIADISTPEKRAQNFGIIGASFGLGFIIGPLIGGLLGQFGSRVPFYAAAFLVFLNGIYGIFILPESLAPENRRKFDWKRANPIGSFIKLQKHKDILLLLIVFFLAYTASHSLQSTWTFFVIEKFQWNEKMIAFSLAFVGIMAAIVQGGLIRFIIPKLGVYKTLITGICISATSYFLYVFASEGWMLYPIIFLASFGGVAGPAIQSITTQKIPSNEQGELQGITTSLMSIASIIGPFVMTYIFYSFTADKNAPLYYFPAAPFILSCVLVLCSLLFVYIYIHKEKKQPRNVS
ncbi:MAG: TCR/Tet family MFS transporter [Chitinophagaceae bacterium]|nr:TCR/Tet family MFS transporter [Chitinophagaceae bacterium]